MGSISPASCPTFSVPLNTGLPSTSSAVSLSSGSSPDPRNESNYLLRKPV